VPSQRREKSTQRALVAERVHTILASKGLTLYRVSQQSAELYGRSSPHFVPHNLYYDLRSEGFSPSVYQIVALSRVSGYRLQDWLRVFDFDLENITRLEVLLPAKRTIFLDTSLTDPTEWVTWFRNRELHAVIPPIAPLAQLLEVMSSRQIGSIAEPNRHFLYAKIGREDAMAFPDLVPGSIVRINPEIHADVSRQKAAAISDRLFLIEHGKGLCCCRIRFLANGVILPFDNGLSYAQVELHIPQQAQVRGAVDLEFRPLLEAKEPWVPRDLAHRWKPQSLPEQQSFGQLLKATRHRLHISTREAARMSHMIAEVLNDDRYICSSSSLSDYELRSTPPRDLHKVITLCSIYGLRFESVMKGMGIAIEQSGTEPMPDRYVSRHQPAVRAGRIDEAGGSTGFLETLLDDCQNEVPLFLRDVLGYFCDSSRHSIDDFFWIGGDREPLHPCLANALVVVVNRRRKTPFHLVSKPLWEQPIYLVLLRDRKYLAACCGLEKNQLVIHPYGSHFHPIAEYRYHHDAEIVGQIVAIARRFP
jgi:transcriptional regulator with XRE-family HTH domain